MIFELSNEPISSELILSLSTESKVHPRQTKEPEPLNIMADDECCSKHFHDAVVAGNVSGEVWTCPECGCEWKAQDHGPNVRQWVSQESFTLIRMRG